MAILESPVRQESDTRKVPEVNYVHGRTSAWPDAEPEQLLNIIYANIRGSGAIKELPGIISIWRISLVYQWLTRIQDGADGDI